MKSASVNKVIHALEAELHRSMKGLRAPGHPKPYYISYLFRHIEGYSVWGRYGSLCKHSRRMSRNLYADVRVGSMRFDQTQRGGLTDNAGDLESFELIGMPLDDHEDALRYAIWRLTDAKYREAVAAFHDRKSENISFRDENENIPSFSSEPPLVVIENPAQMAIDANCWNHYVREASKILKPFTKIKNHWVDFSGRVTTKIFVNSEGRKLVWQAQRYELTAHLWMLSKRGEALEMDLVFNTGSAAELPSLRDFKRRLRERLALLDALEKGDRMTSYSGPALLAAVPAGIFIHEVLGHRLEGSRLLSDDEGRTFKDKSGESITFPGLSLYDDPSIKEFGGVSLTGHYPFDDEGTPPQRATLVTDGVLQGFLTTRAPIAPRGHVNNGHARNERHERPVSRMGNLFVTARDGKTWDELKALLVEEVRRRKLPYGVILLEAVGGETGTEAYDFQAFLGRITVAKKITATGKESYVHGVDFVGTPMSSLAQIIAVGKDLEVDNSFCGAESGLVPVSTISPPILVSSLELQAKDQKRLTPFILPLPWERD